MAILKNYLKIMYDGHTKEWEQRYAEWLNKRYLKSGQKILELGCGEGHLIIKLKELGYDVTGCEYPEVDLEKPLPFNSNEYDVIIIKSVIEHLKDIFTITSEIYRVLKKEGIVIIQTANTVKDLEGWLLDPTHQTMFTPTRLENLFLMHNFKLIQMRSFRNLPYIWRWTLKAFDYNWFPTSNFMGVFKK